MTHEEAITMLRYFKKEDRIARLFPKEVRERVQELNEVCIDALEKQIPKKPNVQVYEYGEYNDNDVSCPCCNALFGSIGDIEQGEIMKIPFCWNCGQSLDWSEVEE